MADIVERLTDIGRQHCYNDRDEAAAEIARLRASERAAFRRGVEAAAAWHDGQAATAETLREWTMARRHRSHAAAIRAIEETPT